MAAGAPLLDFRNDLAFHPEAVESFAARVYEQRLTELRADDRLDRDPALLRKLGDIVKRLAAAAEAERAGAASLNWQVHTCRRCDENAAAMAGGRLLLGEEFLAKLDLSGDELGFLLAHEMAHVLAEHTREFATVARYFVDNGLQRQYWDIQREVDSSLQVQYHMAFVAAQQELEADRIGLFIGARAGLDPPAMIGLLGKLEAGVSSAAPSTHPSQRKRIAQATSMLHTAEVVRHWADRGRADAPSAGQSRETTQRSAIPR
jgi:predicted Zn-dependent protease